jgi:hypothetical protein
LAGKRFSLKRIPRKSTFEIFRIANFKIAHVLSEPLLETRQAGLHKRRTTMETQTRAVDRSNFPTLEANGPIAVQQIRGFLQQAGIELKFPKPEHGLNAQFRLELEVSNLNTFLLVEEKKARSARA